MLPTFHYSKVWPSHATFLCFPSFKTPRWKKRYIFMLNMLPSEAEQSLSAYGIDKACMMFYFLSEDQGWSSDEADQKI